MSARFPLPDDLWVNLANYLRIDDLYSLRDTCRHLRDILSESKTVWQNVIRDLLVPSPNITIARSLKAASTSDLKKTCDSYRAANSLLDIQSPRRYIAVTLSENQYCSYAIPFTALGGQLVPGLACIAYASSNGSVHLVSTKTGEVVDTWSHPEVDALDNATIQICSSETRGVIILVIGKLDQTAGLPHGHLWLFAVDSSSPELSLVPLMTQPVDQSVIAASARDNTLAYIFEDGNPAHYMLAIVELHFPAGAYQQVSPRLYRLGSPFNEQEICNVMVFFPDVVGVFTQDMIALFRISEDCGQTDRHSLPPVLTPYWIREVHWFHGFFLGSLYVSDPDACLLALCINSQSHTLRISRNSFECELHFVSDQICGFPSRHLQLACLQGRGTCTISSWEPYNQDGDMLDIRLCRIEHFKRLIQYVDRLLPSQSLWAKNEVRLSIPCQFGAKIRNIGYDEWIGIIAIQWYRIVGDEPECFMTVIPLSGVTRAVGQATLPVLIQAAPN